MPKILIVAPSWIGDTVLAQPLFKRLHEKLPGLALDVLAPAWVAPLLTRMAEVNQVIPNPFLHGELKLGMRRKLGRELAAHGYEQAIVLPNSFKSALVPWFGGIPMRTGYKGEARHFIINDMRFVDEKRYPQLAERYALLAERPGAELPRPLPQPSLKVDEAARDAALARLGLRLDKPVAAFCPGAEYGPAKRWPADHFAELAKRLHAEGYQVWLFGSPKDARVGEDINAKSGEVCVDLTGRTGLAEAIDLLSCAEFVVSNDSGLMHVAAALDKPMAALYGSSDPGYTPPLSDKARIVYLGVPCSPCFERVCPLDHFNCMVQMTPDRVRAVLPIKHVTSALTKH